MICRVKLPIFGAIQLLVNDLETVKKDGIAEICRVHPMKEANNSGTLRGDTYTCRETIIGGRAETRTDEKKKKEKEKFHAERSFHACSIIPAGSTSFSSRLFPCHGGSAEHGSTSIHKVPVRCAAYSTPTYAVH